MYDQFDSISPIDYRYWDEAVAQYLSEHAFTRYKLQVELALVRVLGRRGVCPQAILPEVETACGDVSTAQVYKEEAQIHHDIKALVNCIRSRVSDIAKPYIHLTATSNDIIDTANARRYRDEVENVLLPALIKLEGTLIEIALREAETVQIGRTHGQHAVPITFGFTIAGYVSRLSTCIEAVRRVAAELPGKFSGAVGAHNASSLLFDDPEAFEAEVLAEMGLTPAECSTQIVPPESFTRLFSEVGITAGVLAALADDMRHLQRTEIGEVSEEFEADQVGSSTMPQKRNPVSLENVKSCWKIVAPRIVTAFLDQLCEHQRDMTNGASNRTHPEILAYVTHMAKQLVRIMRVLKVNRESLERNLNMQQGLVLAEPLYIILAVLGHPNAHEKVRQLTLQAQRDQRSLSEVIACDEELGPYLERVTSRQWRVLSDPSLYTGIAAKKARAVAERWKQRFGL